MPNTNHDITREERQAYAALAPQIRQWAEELGFQQLGISDVDLGQHEGYLQQWLDRGYHGDMAWMAAHGHKRSRPAELLPGTARVISVRMDYLPADTNQIKTLKSPEKAYISRYALGRDYHKLIRQRLSKLGQKIEAAVAELSITEPSFGDNVQQRAFVDSAPVMERPLAAKAGLGWVGKHTLVINPKAGSWFFLGELFTNIPLPIEPQPQQDQCGDCKACLQVCPTDAFPEPYTLDARRCISYLTIENKGAIPEEFRQPIGNRVFGCDDCQAICPWNKFAQFTDEQDFHPRQQLDSTDLVDLFNWSEEEFLKRTEGSAIRRIGHEGWLRNLAIGLGNAPSDLRIIDALERRLEHCSPLVAEHVDWALKQQRTPNKKRKRKIKRQEPS